MSDGTLTSLTLAEAAQLIRLKQVSPIELTRACLERIEALDGQLNSFITVVAEEALEQARRAEAEILSDASVGLLHGVPLALKDLFETQGVRTTAGSKFFAEYMPGEDGEAVRKLRCAGAILIGKTNLHEIALGLTSVNPHYGPVHNPWSLQRIAGGSSGGSAAALAARLCFGSLGSDTGGSIRVPAALCGVAGLKPTFGRVSLRGVIPLSWNLDHAGPMARRTLDLAILLQVIAGYDPEDAYSAQMPVDDYQSEIEQGVRGWRVALAQDEYFENSDPEIQQLVGAAARVFVDLGGSLEARPFPGAFQAAIANGQMVIADAAVFHRERMQSLPEDFGLDVRQRLKNGAALGLSDYIQARRTQTLLRRQFETFFDSYDLLIMPTTPITAPPIDGPDALDVAGKLTRFTAPFNLTGLPAVSIPCGFTSAGLPVGMQIVARPWAEARLLRAAHTFECATNWHLHEPKL